MKELFDFLQMPLSLPISPIWDFIICLVLNEVVFQIAYGLASQGNTSGERSLIHWAVRIPLFFALWCIICAICLVINWIKEHPTLSIIIGTSTVVIVIAVILSVTYLKKKKNAKRVDVLEEKTK